ncbi:MAG: deoxyribodipyrimidine photo-lyase, partial [Halieaceae bacterium]
MRALYWFRNDLRLQDQPGLAAAADAEELLLVYLWPRQRPWCNLQGIGAQRERFVTESLICLDQDLQALGQRLMVLQGSPELVIPDLVRDYHIDSVHCSACVGSYETRALRILAERLPVPVQEHAPNTLFNAAAIAQALPVLPETFSPFRRKVERALQADATGQDPSRLPPPPAVRFDRIPPAAARPQLALALRGGTQAGQRRLRQFVSDGQGIREYKATRNTLDPLQGSSTLSPWLANGCLSAREIAVAIAAHEPRDGANESTAWLYFELLWREYFYWRAREDGIALFRHGGRNPQG